ncbi:lysosomal thioesterase PPT2 homolog [Coccinella septempunctata]|uniref:lysosomal thioesterase PPT2 homolog n=1 Tax=Coccinella septempunctata TaxID=41139 RepID=UPI001D086581|nr:lysosomal thioesterase PPT2 homolog [Coccinella septempunctata]
MKYHYINVSKMKSIYTFIFLSLILTSKNSYAYKPVFLMHGIVTGSISMDLIKSRIQELHPGTIVYNTNKFSGWSSVESMWYQVQQLLLDIKNITEQHPDGIHLLGYSQGALLARSILQAYPEHNIKNFISLSGPQAGQYGTQFLHLIFPGLALKEAYELFYSRVGQHTSVGNYWNDPFHQELYHNFSQYLPYINNELKSTRSAQFKNALTKLNKMVLIGGPDDNVITPWESSQFGFYNDNMTVVNLISRPLYQQDLIGLKTLDESGRLDLITVPGVNHFMWHLNVSIVDNYIINYLD